MLCCQTDRSGRNRPGSRGVLLSANRLIRILGNVLVGVLNDRLGRRTHNRSNRSRERPGASQAAGSDHGQLGYGRRHRQRCWSVASLCIAVGSALTLSHLHSIAALTLSLHTPFGQK